MEIQNVDIKLSSGYELCISDINIYEQNGYPISGKIYFSLNDLRQMRSETHKAECWQAVRKMTLSFWDNATDTFYELEIHLYGIPMQGENSFEVSKILKPIKMRNKT